MKHRGREGGFTLIELMVVVIIIAALAGMVLPRVLPMTDEAKSKIAAGDIAGITTALKLYHLQNGRFPTSDEGLGALVPRYLEKAPRDPWRQDYRYRQPGSRSAGGFDLWSLGADGKDGTNDDVSNWGG